MTDSGVPDEQRVRDVINKEGVFEWNEERYTVEFCEKPITTSGEPKTDTFVRATNEKTNKHVDIKISSKKANFGYLDNHPMKARLYAFYGPECEEILTKMQKEIFGKHPDLQPINFEGEPGFTLGWRNEYLQENTRALGMKLTQDVAAKVWWGEGSPKEYLDATVKGNKIKNSGMPDWLLVKDGEDIKTTKDIFPNLKNIREYAKTHNLVDATWQAHNYKMHRKKTCECGKKYRFFGLPCPSCSSRKWKTEKCPKCDTECKLEKEHCRECKKEGKKIRLQNYISWKQHEGDSRELAVWWKFNTNDEKLTWKLILDEPFKPAGEVRKNLQTCLEKIGVPDDQNFQIDLLKNKMMDTNYRVCSISKMISFFRNKA